MMAGEGVGAAQLQVTDPQVPQGKPCGMQRRAAIEGLQREEGPAGTQTFACYIGAARALTRTAGIH